MFRTLRRYQVATDLSIAAVFLLVQFASQFTTRTGYVSALLLLIFSTALALRRLSPGLALGGAWLGAILQIASALEAPQPFDLAVLAILFATASYGGPVLRWVGLASAILGSFIATFYLVFFNAGRNPLGVNLSSLPSMLSSGVLLLFGCLATLGLSWTLGLLARAVRRSRQSREAQVVAERDVIVEQERNRIARDMHDVVAHSLAVVIAQADGARYARQSDPDTVDVALTTISTTAREALGDVRILLGQLRHTQGETPQPMLADLDALVDQLRTAPLSSSRSTASPRRLSRMPCVMAIPSRRCGLSFRGISTPSASSFRVRSAFRSARKMPTLAATASRECVSGRYWSAALSPRGSTTGGGSSPQ